MHSTSPPPSFPLYHRLPSPRAPMPLPFFSRLPSPSFPFTHRLPFFRSSLSLPFLIVSPHLPSIHPSPILLPFLCLTLSNVSPLCPRLPSLSFPSPIAYIYTLLSFLCVSPLSSRLPSLSFLLTIANLLTFPLDFRSAIFPFSFISLIVYLPTPIPSRLLSIPLICPSPIAYNSSPSLASLH